MAITTGGRTFAWRRGRFDMRNQRQQLLFGRMYEDVAIELEAFPKKSGRVFCIASAGDTAMALAQQGYDVVAVDINPVQLAYAQRRSVGAPNEHGVAESFLSAIRRAGPLAGWSRRRTNAFLELNNTAEQLNYWNRHLNTRRFRAGFDLLLSQPVLRTIYSRALLDLLPPHFGAVMRVRMERCFSRHANRANPWARALLAGEICEQTNSTNATRIEFVCADAADFLEKHRDEPFVGFTISNILDGAPSDYERRLFAAIKGAAAPGAMWVGRSFTEPTPAQAARNCAANDRSMLWGVVDVRAVDEL